MKRWGSGINALAVVKQLCADYDIKPEDITDLPTPLAKRNTIQSPEDAAAWIAPRMAVQDGEWLVVVCLDTRNRPIGKPVVVYTGSLNASLIRVGEVFQEAVKVKADKVIISHNHPSGDPDPSPEDVSITRVLVDAGKLLDIEVIDHIVIGMSGFTSMRARRLGFDE